MRLGRAWLAAPLLSVALLVAVAGPVPATDGGEAPLVVSTAQSDTEISPESDTEPRLIGRESSGRVDAVVIALWSIAAIMTVMLVLFLWHTSPRRRLRLARRRSMQLYDGEADLAEDSAEAGSSDDAEVVDDAEAAAAAAKADAEAVAVVASGADEDPQPAAAALPTAWEESADPAGSQDEDEAESEPDDVVPEPVVPEPVVPEPVVPEPVVSEPVVPEPVVPEPVEQDSGPAEPVVSTAWEEPEVAEPEVVESELPPVWEDEAEPAAEEADPAGGPANESPGAGEAARERMSRLWMQLRRTLGLD